MSIFNVNVFKQAGQAEHCTKACLRLLLICQVEERVNQRGFFDTHIEKYLGLHILFFKGILVSILS